MQTHTFGVSCPYCDGGHVSICDRRVYLPSRCLDLERLTHDEDELARHEAESALCEHFIAGHVSGYVDEVWFTERLPWLQETLSACRKMCSHSELFLAGMRSAYECESSELITEIGPIACTIVFAEVPQSFVLELLSRLFPPVPSDQYEVERSMSYNMAWAAHMARLWPDRPESLSLSSAMACVCRDPSSERPSHVA